MNDERLERQKLARLREWQHFKESLYELQMDEAACPACRMARIIHETETNSPVCRGHAEWRRAICFTGWGQVA